MHTKRSLQAWWANSPDTDVFSFSNETWFSRYIVIEWSDKKCRYLAIIWERCNPHVICVLDNKSWDIDILSIRSDKLPSVRRSRIKCTSFSSDQPNHLFNRRPVHSWNCGWWDSMKLSYWNLFGGPTVRVEKLQTVDTRIPSVAWAGTHLRRSWYLIYEGLLEEDVSGKGQTSWRVEHS